MYISEQETAPLIGGFSAADVLGATIHLVGRTRTLVTIGIGAQFLGKIQPLLLAAISTAGRYVGSLHLMAFTIILVTMPSLAHICGNIMFRFLSAEPIGLASASKAMEHWWHLP